MKTGKNGRKKLRSRYSISRRVILCALLVLLVPLALGLWVYSAYSASTMEKEIFLNMRATVRQGKDNIDYRMEQVESSTMAILSSAYQSLCADGDLTEQMNEYATITKLLSEYQGKSMMTKLRMFVPDEKLYSRQRDTFYALSSLEGEQENYLGTQWVETRTITLRFGESRASVISCVTGIGSLDNYGQLVGVLSADVAVNQLDETLSTGLSEGQQLFIVNKDGCILAHPDVQKLGTDAFAGNAPVFMESDSLRMTVDGKEALVSYARLQCTDWYLVMTEPRDKVFTFGLFSLDMARLAVMGFMTCCAVAAYQMLVKNAVARVNLALKDAVDNTVAYLEDGTQAEGGSGTTLAALEENTNQLVQNVKALLDQRYQEQLALRDYQMQSLQAQINPHFLYNTLDVIKWMIADGRNDDSMWMINMLSRYFRLSLSHGRDIVHISEEMELTKIYLNIMSKRFENVFVPSFDVEDGVGDYLIPKLSIQPIIENALLHGILYTRQPERHLYIRAGLDNGYIIVEVEDDGNGMDEETLAIIREGKSTGKSYGLGNVVKRMQLFGSGPEDFEVHSQLGVGTCVTLRFPAKSGNNANSGK